MEPAQARRPGPKIQRKRKSTEDDLGAVQPLIALLARADWSCTLAEVALNRPRRPGLTELDVKPAPSIDHMQASVDCRDTTQRVVGYRHDHEDFFAHRHGPQSTVPPPVVLTITLSTELAPPTVCQRHTAMRENVAVS